MKLPRIPTLKKTSPLNFKSGFALVVTLSLMILLTLIAVGLLSLSAISLRSSGASSAQATAQANARLGLMIAIGELQKNLGPDQRTSATANLLKDDFKNPQWVGAWNTEGGFRGWLVSGNETIIQPAIPKDDIPSPPFTPDFNFTSAPSVRLVGKNTLGDKAPATDHVFAPLVSLTQNTKPTGRYAWWVGDEGVKANLASPVTPLPDSSAGVAGRLQYLASAPNRGFPTMGGAWEKWLPAPDGPLPDADVLPSKLVSRKQVSLANPDLIPSEEDKASFHDFTTSSAGVLSDSKNGGLRKDLSIAFEIPESSFKNSEFTRVLTAGEQPNAYATNHDGTTRRLIAGSTLKNRFTKTAVNYREDAWPSSSAYRGPTFDQLRDHYQLYRQIQDPFSGSATIPAHVFKPNRSDILGGNPGGPERQKAPWADYYGPDWEFSSKGVHSEPYALADTYSAGAYTRIRPMTTELVPELLRYTFTFAIQSFLSDHDNNPATPEAYQIRLIMTPFFVIHNPYNITLNTNALWLRIKYAEMSFRIRAAAVGADPAIDSNALRFRRLIQEAGLGDDSQIQGDQGDLAASSIDYFLSDNGEPSGGLTLKPGEIKLFTMTGSSAVDAADFLSVKNPAQNRNMFFSPNLGDLFSTGVYVTARKVNGFWGGGSSPLILAPDRRFTVSISNDVEGQGTKPTFPDLGWSKDEWHKIWMKLVPPGISRPIPVGEYKKWDAIRQVQFFPNDYWTGGLVNLSPATQLTPLDIEGTPDGPRRYIGKIDMYLKPAVDGPNRNNNFSLSIMNPRAMVQSPATGGGQGPASTRGPGTWAGSIEALNPGTSSSPGFESRFWGTASSLADGGSSKVVLYDIPRSPMTSIAEFQNANLSRMWTAPAYAVGNSYATPYTPADKVWNQSTIKAEFWNLDDSYIFNDALFDSYFFSGVNPGTSGSAWKNPLSAPAVTLASDPTSASPLKTQLDEWRNGTANPANPLLNPRFKFSIPSGRSSSQAATDLDVGASYSSAQTKLDAAADIRPHNAIAAYIQNFGAFNVNSVSVNAWRALLAGLRGAAVDHFNGNSLAVSTATASTPFPRSSMPGADSSTGSDTELWNGFRSLDDTELEDLAKAIVKEIKDRAQGPTSGKPRPFTTLAEFVNRRLALQINPFSRSGVLQAALDQTVNKASDLTGVSVQAAETSHVSNLKPNGGASDSTTIPYANPSAMPPATISGTPQWLTQADLLEKIGPQLSARSDTFTIRAYGESLDSAGQVKARAWLEAVVQREPGFVNPADHPALPLLSGSLSDVSKRFGRRFQVVSLRWLNSNEI